MMRGATRETSVRDLNVHLARDEESGWWYVGESDIPGLVLEAETAAELMRKIELAAPEMIQLNLAEIVAVHLEGEAGHSAEAAPTHRTWAYRPIFDSPLAACA